MTYERDTTDDELLEDAAHAAGNEVARWSDDGAALLLEGIQEPWDPLSDDGDALRLAAQLRISVGYDGHAGGEWAFAQEPERLDTVSVRYYERIDKDPAAAYRRVIVRAAAAMALQPPNEPHQ
jgi:hypothetical protein